MKVVTIDQMRDIERQSEQAGVSTDELMETAGLSVATEAARSLGETTGKRVLVLVGPGNNGGDGLVAARHLHEWGADVTAYIWRRDGIHDEQLSAARQRGIAMLRAEENPDRTLLVGLLGQSDLVIDALLGTGRARPVSGDLRAILDTVNRGRRKGPLLAVDLPTGLNADTAEVDESCLRADLTVTLGCPKLGLLAFPGALYAGRLIVGSIGLPAGVTDHVMVEMTTQQDAGRLLPPRPVDAHKGTFGKVMVVGGSSNYIGAPVLVALAAGRAGAGLVTLACAESLLPIFASKLTEATFVPLACAGGSLAAPAHEALLGNMVGYNTIVLGPGLGRAPATVDFVRATLVALRSRTDLACVIDADAINALSVQADWHELLPPRSVLTPHAQEMARLLRIDATAVNADRLKNAREAARNSGSVIVLKGPFSVIAHPDGRATINPAANAALASAGTGDVLAGVVGGLLAQGLDTYHAAVAGVFIHSLAGDLVSSELGDAGLLASDLLPAIPKALRMTRDCLKQEPDLA